MTYTCQAGFQPATLWQIVNDLNRKFQEGSEAASPASATWTPAVDVTETPTAYYVEADLPGLKSGDFELEVIGDTLTLKGSRKSGESKESEKRHRSERRYGSFERTFHFPEQLVADKVEAKFADGVLRVTLPKPVAAQPHKVEINVN